MTQSFNLDPVTRITAGAVGEPGSRTFYIQARKDDVVVSLLAEKTQVESLARHVDALLSRLADARSDLPESPDSPESELELEEPVVEEFRVGQMSLGYDAERDLVLLECEELVPEPEEEDAPAPEASIARFWATRGQVRAMARYASDVAAHGRPRCELCGRPMDPGGHTCPALNGHRDRGPRLS